MVTTDVGLEIEIIPFPVKQVRRDIANFGLKLANFRHHGNNGRCGVNFNGTVNLREPETPVSSKNLGHIYYTG